MCKFMGKELRKNAPAARGSEDAGFTQFRTPKSTPLRISVPNADKGVGSTKILKTSYMYVPHFIPAALI